MTTYFLLIILLLTTGQACAAGNASAIDEQSVPQEQTKELSGMSIVGNDEAPKSLYIVPWKSSELGDVTSMNGMLNEREVPVDREVFMRQLHYYEITAANSGGHPGQEVAARAENGIQVLEASGRDELITKQIFNNNAY